MKLRELTLDEIFDLYREYVNDWLTLDGFSKHYGLTREEFFLAQLLHNEIEDYIVRLNKKEWRTK
jgi:hypothetical protein